jgi:hypothetical protein
MTIAASRIAHGKAESKKRFDDTKEWRSEVSGELHMGMAFPPRCVILMLLFAAGCSGGNKGPDTARVAGTLYLDDKPLEGAEVRYFSMGFVGYAMSGPDGRYELVQGAVPGENIVTVKKFEGDFELNPEEGYDLAQLEFEQDAATGGGDMRGKPRTASKIKQVVPLHFSDPEKSQLTYSVPEDGTTSADLRLTTN